MFNLGDLGGHSINKFTFIAASLFGAGITAGKKALAENIEKQKISTIEAATALASEKLDREVTTMVRKGLEQLLNQTLIKFILIASLFILYQFSWLTGREFAIIASILLTLFLIRDIVKFWPTGRIMIKSLHENNWHPKQAISHYISASVFDQALLEVTKATQKPKTKIMLHLAGTSQKELSLEIAATVANIAHETSFEQIRPRLYMATLRAITIMAVYSAILFVIFRLI